MAMEMTKKTLQTKLLHCPMDQHKMWWVSEREILFSVKQ